MAIHRQSESLSLGERLALSHSRRKMKKSWQCPDPPGSPHLKQFDQAVHKIHHQVEYKTEIALKSVVQ